MGILCLRKAGPGSILWYCGQRFSVPPEAERLIVYVETRAECGGHTLLSCRRCELGELQDGRGTARR